MELEIENMIMKTVRQFIAVALTSIFLPAAVAFAQSEMPDQRATSHVLAGSGLTQNGRMLNLSVPVSASNGGAGTVSGILKANGSGTVSAASPRNDYAPATSGNSLLKGSGAGGFTMAMSGTDYAPPTSGTVMLRGNGAGAFATASPSVDYAPATSGTAILKGNGSGGFTSALSATDYAPATLGSAILKGNGLGSFASTVSGTDYQAPIAGNTLAAHNFDTSISKAGAVSGAQPAFSDLSGRLTSTQMTGDSISTAGSTVTTNLKLNGVSYQANPSTDTVPVITGTNTATYTPLSNCVDSGGNHLNYSTSTHAFACGTSSSASTPAFLIAQTALTINGVSKNGICQTEVFANDDSILCSRYGASVPGLRIAQLGHGQRQLHRYDSDTQSL